MAVTFQDKVELLGKYKDKEGYETLIQAYKFGKNIDSPKLNDAQRNQIRTNIDTLYKELSAEIKKQKARESKSATGGKKKTILGLASEIRKRDNITWDKAKAKARMEFQSERKQAIREEKQDLADFKKRIGKINFLRATTYTKQGKVVSTDIKKDKVIPALPSGKRYPKRGKTTNGEGTFKNNTKKPYWENRANRMDVNQPSKQAKIKLADGGNIDKNIRFDVDFYDDNNTRKETSVELILRGSSLENVIKDAIKKAYELKKNYIEFYNRNSFLGSINLAISSDFREGKYYRDYREGKIKLADGGQMNTAKYYWNTFDKERKIDFLVSAGYSKSVANDLSNENWDSLESGVHKQLLAVLMADGGVIGSGKNGYIAFYKGKRIEVMADTIYGAQQTAAKHFKAKKEYEVNVSLAEVDGKQYIQSASFAKGGEVGGNFEVINFGGDRYDGGVSYEIKQNGKSVQKGLIDGDSGIDFNGKHYSGLLSLTKALNAKFVTASEYAKGGKVGGKEYFTIFSDEDGTIKTEFDNYEEGLADFHYFVEEDANISLYMVVNGEEKLLEEYTSSANIEYLKLGNSDVVVTLEKVDGKWQEMDVVEGEKPYGWGGKRYMGYLKPMEIVRYLNSDYGGTFEIIEQYAKGGEVDVYNLKKGDSVRTRDGKIETIIRKTGSGSYETEENDYSHSPESLEFVSRPSRKMAQGGSIGVPLDMINEFKRNGLLVVSNKGEKGVILKESPKNSYNESDYTKSYIVKTEDGEKEIMARHLRVVENKMAKGGEVKIPIKIKNKLEAIRKSIQNENVSYGELVELQSLSKYIDPSDVELRESAGIPEFEDEDEFAKGGEVENMYVAVGEKDGYWTIISRPSSKENAQKLLDLPNSLPRGEVGKVVSVEDAKKHKLVVGREYLKYAKGTEFEKGGEVGKNYALIYFADKKPIKKNYETASKAFFDYEEMGSTYAELYDAKGIFKSSFPKKIEYAKGGETKKFGYSIELLVKKDYGNEDMVIANFVGKGDAMISARALNENSPENYDYSVKESSKIAKKGTASSLSSVEKKYLENEDENRHSENLILLAENFGNVNDLKLAKEILRKHNEEGSLSSENGKKRQNLHLKLITIAREEFAKEGIKFEKGGEIAEGNYEMMLSQAKEVQHHAKELQNILKNEKEIEAWVVAKMENVSSTLSDITHYLDGKTEYAKGGTTKRIKRMSK